jgi:hypothetical protein
VPLILAIEPDRHQAGQLQAIARGRLHAELVLEATAERALAALGDRIPDLILTAALLSPKDEAALAGRLRELNSAAAHIHTLTIPALASPRSRPRMGGVLSALRREKSLSSEPDGCDPAVFAEQCATYLERAMAGRTDFAATTTYEEPALVPEQTGQEPFETLPYSIDDPPNTLNTEAATSAEDIRSFVDETFGEAPVEEPVSDISCEIAAEAAIAEPVDEAVVEDVIEEPFVEDTLDEATTEAAVEAPVVDEPLDEPDADQPWAASIVEEVEKIVEPPAFVDPAPSMHDEDVVLDESPLFELVTEAESESAAGTEEDLDRYIELDLSEFLDQSTPMLHAVAASGDDASPEETTETDVPGVAPVTPMEAGPAEPDEADWLEVVEALRRDVERLDATPVAPPRPPRPLKKALRKPLKKGKPIQDEWGFFDPEQCGFAALLAKLDEVTAKPNARRRQK